MLSRLLLRDVLREIRNTEGLTRSESAARLGISHTAYGKIEDGKLEIGSKILSAIVKSYPQLMPEVLIYLRDRNKKGGSDA